MSRYLSALAVIFMVAMIGNAQPKQPVPAPAQPAAVGSADGSIEVVKKNGQSVWVLHHSGAVGLIELVEMFCASRGIKYVPIDRKQIGQRECGFMCPAGGAELTGDEISSFVSDLAAWQQFTLVGFTRGGCRLVNANDAVSCAVVVDAAELATIDAAEYVQFVFNAQYAEANNLAAAVRGVLRQPSYLSPIGSGVLFGGRASVVRDMVRLAKLADVPRQSDLVIARYEMPEGVEPRDAITVLGGLFASADGKRGSVISFDIVPNSKAMLVRASSSDQEAVKSALKLLK